MKLPGTIIYRARQHVDLSQAQYGLITGHTQATISRWEAGIWTPDAYDVTMAEAIQRSKVRNAARLLHQHGPIYCLGQILGRIHPI